MKLVAAGWLDIPLIAIRQIQRTRRYIYIYRLRAKEDVSDSAKTLMKGSSEGSSPVVSREAKARLSHDRLFHPRNLFFCPTETMERCCCDCGDG
jgi:hypothetical protein